MSYRRLGYPGHYFNGVSFGSAATEAAAAGGQVLVDAAGKGTLNSPATYGQFVQSITHDVATNPKLQLSPVTSSMIEAGGAAAGTIVAGIAGGEDAGDIAEQIAWLLADIVVGVVKDVVKDVLAVVPVLGSIVNIIIDAAAGAARVAAAQGRSGDADLQKQEAEWTAYCVQAGAIGPVGYGGHVLPADILTAHSGPKFNKMPALGRAIMALVFPTPADLEAVAWYALPRAQRIALLGSNLANVVPGGVLLQHVTEANSCNYLFRFNPQLMKIVGNTQAWRAVAMAVRDRMLTQGFPNLAQEVMQMVPLTTPILERACVTGRIVSPPPSKGIIDPTTKQAISLVRSGAAPRYAVPAKELLTMQRAVRAIQSQYLDPQGSGGAELWPALMDLLLHQVKSGQINDAAISILLSRHSEDDCFDENQGLLLMLYGAIDLWNEKAHPIYKPDREALKKQFSSVPTNAVRVAASNSVLARVPSSVRSTIRSNVKPSTTKKLFIVKRSTSPVAAVAIGMSLAAAGAVLWKMNAKRAR